MATKTSTEQRAWRALKPLIDHCRERGNMKDVVSRFNRLVSDPRTRSAIDRWLRQDEDKRTEPQFGAGLVLLEVWEEIQDELMLAAKFPDGTKP